MNILFLTPRNSKKHLGGVEGHVRLLTEELVRRGHEVKELALEDSIKVTPCEARCHLFKFKAWVYLWKKRELFKWADVIHVHDVFWWVMPLLPVVWWGRLDCHVPPKARLAMTKTKVFVTFHGWEGVCPPTRSAVWQKRAAAFLSNGTIGVGNFFEKWYGVKTDWITWGVLDPKTTRLPRPAFGGARNDGIIRVAFFGRLEEVNGIEILLGALKVTPLDRKDGPLHQRTVLYRFIFIGDGSYRKQAEKFGEVTGMVKNPQKYLHDADVVITSSYMSMLEAAAMGKPIIAIANSKLKEDYLNCHPLRKWIKVCKNSVELVGRIASLQLRKDAIRAAQDWAVGQTPERLADVYEELWKKYSLSFRAIRRCAHDGRTA